MLYLLLIEEKKKKERKGRNSQGLPPNQGRHTLLAVPMPVYFTCKVQLKAVLRVDT
jgi:hypothetical protein